MDSMVVDQLLNNIHWVILIAGLGLLAITLLRHKQRRQKKLLKVLKRHGILDNQQRFQS